MNFYDQIEDYINKSLTEQDLLAFEKAMSEDKRLRQAVDDFSFAKKISESLIEDETRQQLTSLRNNGIQLNKQLLLKILSIAAIFIFAGTAYFLYRFLKPESLNKDQIIAELYEAPSSTSERGAKDGLSTLDSARMYFDQESPAALKVSERLFSRLTLLDSTAMISNFYLAHIAFKNKDLALAKTLFEKIAQDPASKYKDEACYNLILLYYISEDRTNAKKMFEYLNAKNYIGENKKKKIAQLLR